MNSSLTHYHDYPELPQIKDLLVNLPAKEFIALLREVFSERVTFPGESDDYKSRYFLGVATRELESEENQTEIWGDLEITAVSYMNPKYYNPGREPDGPFWQFGTCTSCNIPVTSTVKRGICSICGSEVYLT